MELLIVFLCIYRIRMITHTVLECRLHKAPRVVLASHLDNRGDFSF